MGAMTEKTEWLQVWSWWWGTPYLVVFDPKQVVRSDPLAWVTPSTRIDDEELEVQELAQQLVMLKRAKKH